MTCYSPIQLKKPRTLKEGTLADVLPIPVPCGRCDGCLLERSRQWAVRCMHEQMMHESSYFLTLTYNDENLVWGANHPTLYKPHLQKFFKRLRKRLKYPLRFFACGEYGTEGRRPHYHAIVFGLQIDDLIFYRTSEAGHKVYLSKFLTDVWSYGDVYIGDVTFQSCAYVARYTLKKQFGPDARIYKELGLQPEFSTCSLKPGIGGTWLNKYFFDVFPLDVCVSNGIKMKPPRYYLKLLQKSNPTLYLSIMNARKTLALDNMEESSTSRLKIKAIIKKHAISRLRRS